LTRVESNEKAWLSYKLTQNISVWLCFRISRKKLEYWGGMLAVAWAARLMCMRLHHGEINRAEKNIDVVINIFLGNTCRWWVWGGRN
jgi:hypothetical protein